jgi:hypothetical protein
MLVAAASTLGALLAGCDTPPPAGQPKPKPPSPVVQPAPKRVVPRVVRRRSSGEVVRARSDGHPADVVAQQVRKLGVAIRQSLEVGPTVVVWLIDRTPSAAELVGDVKRAARELYAAPSAGEPSEAKLATAVIGFDEQVEFVLDPPASEADRVVAALEGLASSKSAQEHTFTALEKALEKYLPLRTREGKELLLVVVSDEAGDDDAQVDRLVERTRRQAVPVYVIGLPAPWGQTNPLSPNPKQRDAADREDNHPTYGPESLRSERVDLEDWSRSGSGGAMSLVDAGFGPFALERLCRASRGQFFIVRPELGFGFGARGWPAAGALTFDEAVLAKYAPDYVSAAEYEKLLAENKARAALSEAAQLPKVMIEGYPGTRFPKAAEAKMAKEMSQAQQFAARNLPPIDRLYAILSQGEADREKLSGPRWQAQFDLAIGRVMATKARLDGYNSMLAALKRGKTFQNPSSTEWVLEPADVFETESSIRRMAERAKMYLERVVREHPGTPWARIAEEELRQPMGWKWREA